MRDVRDMYVRSVLGPFWGALGLAVQVAVISAIFSTLSDQDPKLFLTHLTLGLALWGFITTWLIEATSSFGQAQRLMLQMRISPIFPLVRTAVKNVILFGHNLPVVFIVLSIGGIGPSFTWWVAVVGFFALIVVTFLVASMVSLLSARFRDVAPILTAVLTVIFYATPILWSPNDISAESLIFLLRANPFYHLIEVFRAPLLGSLPESFSWGYLVVLVGVFATAVGFAYKRFAREIIFWL